MLVVAVRPQELSDGRLIAQVGNALAERSFVFRVFTGRAVASVYQVTELELLPDRLEESQMKTGADAQ